MPPIVCKEISTCSFSRQEAATKGEVLAAAFLHMLQQEKASEPYQEFFLKGWLPYCECSVEGQMQNGIPETPGWGFSI